MLRQIQIKVYNSDCLTVVGSKRLTPAEWSDYYITTIKNIELSGFSRHINNDYSAADIEASIKKEDLNQDKLWVNKIVVVYLSEFFNNTTKNRRIYVGKINRLEILESNKQAVRLRLELQGMMSQLARTVVTLSSDFNFSNTQTLNDQLRFILSQTNTSFIYTNESLPPTTGPIVDIRYNNLTALEALNMLVSQLDPTEYFYIDENMIFNLKSYSTTPDLLLTAGRDVIDYSESLDVSNYVTDVYAYNGDSTSPVTHAEQLSSSEYDLRSQTLKTFNVGSDSSALQASAVRYLQAFKNPSQSLALTIAHDPTEQRGKDIYQIRPGQTFKLLNQNQITGLRVISSVNYNFNSAEIITEDYNQFSNRLLFENSQQSKIATYQNGPSFY